MQQTNAAKTWVLREYERSSVFLRAVLAYRGESKAVRVRNISATGALLDGNGLPPEGTAVVLRRGDLCAVAEVAWQGSNNCGICFNRPINIEPWVTRVGHAGQRRIDDILTTLRAGGGSDAGFDAPPGDSLEEISIELTRISEDLGNLPTLTLELAERVLRLDVVAQRLRNWVADSK